MKPLSRCILTGEAISDFQTQLEKDGRPTFSYSIRLGNEAFSLKFCGHCFTDQLIASFNTEYSDIIVPHVIKGHLLNGKLVETTKDLILWELRDEYDDEPKGLLARLQELTYPKSSQEKLDNLFNAICNLQPFEGATISYDQIGEGTKWQSLYFRHERECQFYTDSLLEMGLLAGEDSLKGLGMQNWKSYRLTYKGLVRRADLVENGQNSNKVFIAMCFHKGMEAIRAAIKAACEVTGFLPILIDEVDHNKTINDALINEIKSCKFCIADFTMGRNAVYWEAGFALGLGKPVILTCQKSDFDLIDFDTKAFPHIIYETADQLEVMLVDRIKARL
jgi:hypothetical protein